MHAHTPGYPCGRVLAVMGACFVRPQLEGGKMMCTPESGSDAEAVQVYGSNLVHGGHQPMRMPSYVDPQDILYQPNSEPMVPYYFEQRQ